MRRKTVTITQYYIGWFALWSFVTVAIMLQIVFVFSGVNEVCNITKDCSQCDLKSMLLFTESLIGLFLWTAVGFFSGFTKEIKVVRA